MPLSPAEKQRAYRERKKKQDYLSNAYSVTKVMNDAHRLGNEAEMAELIEDLWEIGGEKLVERTCFLIYSVTSSVVVLRDRAAADPGEMLPKKGGLVTQEGPEIEPILSND